VMIHQPSGGFSGQVSDIERHANYIVRLKQRYNKHMAEFTGKSVEEIDRASDRDNFLTAEESLEFGMIDKVLDTRVEPAKS
jgi:ATP-dependent Clp protease, protease subunit